MKWFSTYHTLRKFVYVQVHLEQQTQRIRYVVVNRKDEQHKTPVWIEVEDVNELIQKAGKYTPYVVHFFEFGLLTRIVENAPNYKESLLVNGTENDFYFNSFTFKTTVSVSFLRRSLVQELTSKLTEQRIFLWGIYCGPISLCTITGENTAFSLDYHVEIVNGDIRKLERNSTEIGRFKTDTDWLSVDQAYISSVQQSIYNPSEQFSQGIDIETLKATQSNYKEFVRFAKLGVGILSFFLITLTANYFYINHLNDTTAQLELDITSYGENLALIDRLNQEKQRKLVLIENSGVQSQRYVSFYLDEIGSSVPKSVELTQLETFPLIEPLKPKRKVEINTQQILISGISDNSKILDDWMELLGAKKWASGVELINYVRLSGQRATFNILVKIGV